MKKPNLPAGTNISDDAYILLKSISTSRRVVSDDDFYDLSFRFLLKEGYIYQNSDVYDYDSAGYPLSYDVCYVITEKGKSLLDETTRLKKLNISNTKRFWIGFAINFLMALAALIVSILKDQPIQ